MWKFAGAQAIGTSHLRSGLPCQDRFACVIIANGGILAVVADGAGSADKGDEGAEAVVSSVVSTVTLGIEGGRTDYSCLLTEAVKSAREEIVSLATFRNLEIRRFATTLLAILIAPTGGAAVQVGDGVIVVRDGEQEWNWVFWPQKGEYANTTFFVTDEDSLDRLQVEVMPSGVIDLAVVSDGLEALGLHYATKEVHDPFFNGLIRPLIDSDGQGQIRSLCIQLEDFLRSDRIRSRTDDDVCIVMATVRGKPEVP